MKACQEPARNKARLLAMLYNEAIKHLKQAVRKIKGRKYPEAEQRISQALEIIHELNEALDMEAGGKIAQNLRRLYAFAQGRLNQAKEERDESMVQEIIALLEELNQSWRTLA